VRFVSEGSSLADIGFSSTSTFGVEAGGGGVDGLATSFFGADEKRARSCGESLNITIRDFFILSDRGLGVGVTLWEEGVDMVCAMDGWCLEELWWKKLGRRLGWLSWPSSLAASEVVVVQR
jgi:hypothetical protein